MVVLSASGKLLINVAGEPADEARDDRGLGSNSALKLPCLSRLRPLAAAAAV